MYPWVLFIFLWYPSPLSFTPMEVSNIEIDKDGVGKGFHLGQTSAQSLR